jgi:hypothetical protein
LVAAINNLASAGGVGVERRYSPAIREKACNALRELFRSAGLGMALTDSNEITIQDREIVFCGKALRFPPGSKAVTISILRFSEPISVEGPAARAARSSVKEWVKHKETIDAIPAPPSLEPFECDPPLPGRPAAQRPDAPEPGAVEELNGIGKILQYFSYLTTATHSFPVVISVSNVAMQFLSMVGIGLGAILHNLSSIIHIVTAVAVALGPWIAFLRAFQGIVDLLHGTTQLVSSIVERQEAQRVHDADGAEIAKKKIISSVLMLAIGFAWIGMGIAMVICPQVALAGVGIYCACLFFKAIFYASFLADALYSLNTAQRVMQILRKQYYLFEEGILKNPNLATPEEKNQASRCFVEQLLNVTEMERAKMQKKLRGEDIAQRVAEKRAKKIRMAQRIGITGDIQTESDSELFQKIQERFNASIQSQKRAVLLSRLSLVITALGLGFEIPSCIKT